MAEYRGAFPAQRARLALRRQRCDAVGLCAGHMLLLAYGAGLLVSGVTGAAAPGWVAGAVTMLVLVLAPRWLHAVAPWPRRLAPARTELPPPAVPAPLRTGACRSDPVR